MPLSTGYRARCCRVSPASIAAEPVPRWDSPSAAADGTCSSSNCFGPRSRRPGGPDSLLVAARRAAGQDYAGTVPDHATWYGHHYKVFDNLYVVGTRIRSAWALTTSQGIVIIDTLFDYAIEPVPKRP